MRALISALLGLLLATVAVAQSEPESEFDAGNRAFDDKKFLEARQHYEALVSQGVWTANVFYNLGSTNQQIGADGLAMLNFERALALEPQHREAYAALDLLRKNSTAKLPPRTWRQTALGLFNFGQWIIVASVAGWLAIFSWLIAIARRRALGFGGRALVSISLAVAAVAATAAWFTAGELNTAIIIAKQVEARLAPADRATLADVLPAGSRVEWLTQRSGWVECRLPGGTRAWIPTTAVERVRLSASS